MRCGWIPLLAFALAGCGERATLPFEAGVGPEPVLPPPNRTLIPTVKIAPAVGWANGDGPSPASDLRITALATGLEHPRWLYVLPNGDVLVAETNAPERPRDDDALKAKVMGLAMKVAGAAVPSADRITLLRDADGDGVAELRTTFMENLTSPFGMALVGDTLYIANTDALVRVPYRAGLTRIDTAPEKVVDLPAGPRNHHWTKNVIASPDGSRLYVTVGSNSNIAEHGMDAEVARAAILEVDPAARSWRVFASGLRNPNGLGWRGDTLWTVVNERDELGSDLVPDYLTSVQRGGFYGWPYSYFGQHVDTRPQPPRPDLVARAIVPDYALGTHVAPLGLAFTGANATAGIDRSRPGAERKRLRGSRDGRGDRVASGDTTAGNAGTSDPAPPVAAASLPRRYGNGAFIGLHGSWNRRPPAGYKVVFVPFSGARPAGHPIDVLTGFLDDDGRAQGRPVGVVLDRRGALLVADDVGNAVWRLSAAAPGDSPPN